MLKYGHVKQNPKATRKEKNSFMEDFVLWLHQSKQSQPGLDPDHHSLPVKALVGD
jgi:hypothetical protein